MNNIIEQVARALAGIFYDKNCNVIKMLNKTKDNYIDAGWVNFIDEAKTVKNFTIQALIDADIPDKVIQVG